MLEIKEYTRSELIELYKTSRIDAIRNKIQREGYKFTENGWGKKYTMTITNLPDQDLVFRDYCINELNFAPQTDFKLLKVFLYNFIFDDTFKDLQFNEMVKRLAEQNIRIAAQTVSRYFNHLKNLGWIDYLALSADDYIYYIYDLKDRRNKYITAELYKEAWKEYWKQVERDKNKPDRFQAAEQNMYLKYNGKPKKRMKPTINGFYANQIRKLETLLQ